MHEIKAIIRRERLDDVLRVLHSVEHVPGVTVSVVRGFGRRHVEGGEATVEYGEVELCKLEVVVADGLVGAVADAVEKAAHTGRAGDGKIFVIPVSECIKIRSGARGPAAL